MVAVTKKPLINPNLVTLKLVLFTFFGGLGCIFPFIPAHLRAIGFNADESRWIQVAASGISILGPVLAFLLADRWIGVKKTASYGAYLRIITALFMLIGGILFGLMLLVPRVVRIEDNRPLVSFSCDLNGALIFQEKCTEEKLCHHWDEPQRGWLHLTNCSYTCQKPIGFEDLYQPWIFTQQTVQPNRQSKNSPPQSAPLVEYSQEFDYDDSASDGDRTRRQVVTFKEKPNPPPHVCVKEDGKPEVCHAYTPGTEYIKLQAVLNTALQDEENDTISQDWCRYPINNYQCHIPEEQIKLMSKTEKYCKPAVECSVVDPYEKETSVLRDSVCVKVRKI